MRDKLRSNVQGKQVKKSSPEKVGDMGIMGDARGEGNRENVQINRINKKKIKKKVTTMSAINHSPYQNKELFSA